MHQPGDNDSPAEAQGVAVDIGLDEIRRWLGQQPDPHDTPPVAAVRELVLNAQEAVLARQMVDNTFRNNGDGEVTVSLAQDGDDWILIVRDDGIGMDENVIRNALLDFGRTGAPPQLVRDEPATGRPVGRSGVGFYLAFLLGDEVTLTTRRYGLTPRYACQVTFSDGLNTRPVLSGLVPDEDRPVGTTVRVKLASAPASGLFARTPTPDCNLHRLIQRLVPSRHVPVTVLDRGPEPHRLAPCDIHLASPEEVFDQLYPSWLLSGQRRAKLRAEFCLQASELRDSDGQRLGLAVLGRDLVTQDPELKGAVLVDGCRAGEHEDFTGYLLGMAPRASRDHDVELACGPEELTGWVTAQVRRLQDRAMFGPSQQLELADGLYRSALRLPGDLHLAMTTDGLITIDQITAWAAGRDEIFFSYGWPCEWSTRPPVLQHPPTGTLSVTPPEGWLVPYLENKLLYLDRMLPRSRDAGYEQHKDDVDETWQQRWWLASDLPEGLMFQLICDAWGCTMEDLLAPVANRGWRDEADLGIPGLDEPAPGMHFKRPS